MLASRFGEPKNRGRLIRLGGLFLHDVVWWLSGNFRYGRLRSKPHHLFLCDRRTGRLLVAGPLAVILRLRGYRKSGCPTRRGVRRVGITDPDDFNAEIVLAVFGTLSSAFCGSFTSTGSTSGNGRFPHTQALCKIFHIDSGECFPTI